MSQPFSIRGTLTFADASTRDAARGTIEAAAPLPDMAQEGVASIAFAVDVVAPARLYERAISALFDAADRAVGGSVVCMCGDESLRIGPPPRRQVEASNAAAVDRVASLAHAGDVVTVWLGSGTLQWSHLARPEQPVRRRLGDEEVYGIAVAGSLVCWWGSKTVGLFDVGRDAICWRVAIDDPVRAFVSARGVLVSVFGGVVQLRDVATGVLVGERPMVVKAVRGGRLAVAETALQLGVYALATLERVGGAAVDLSSIASSALSADGRWAVAADVHGKLSRLDSASGAVHLTRAPQRCSNASISEDGRFTALSSRQHLCVHDAESDAWIELRGGPDGHGLEANNNHVIAVAGDAVLARDPFRARAWRLDRPNDPADLVLPDGQRNCGALRRSDGAVFLLDGAGRLHAGG